MSLIKDAGTAILNMYRVEPSQTEMLSPEHFVCSSKPLLPGAHFREREPVFELLLRLQLWLDQLIIMH